MRQSIIALHVWFLLAPPFLVLLLVLSIGGVDLEAMIRVILSCLMDFCFIAYGLVCFCCFPFFYDLFHVKYQHLLVLCRIVKRLAYEHQVIDGICQRLNGYTSHQQSLFGWFYQGEALSQVIDLRKALHPCILRERKKKHAYLLSFLVQNLMGKSSTGDELFSVLSQFVRLS